MKHIQSHSEAIYTSKLLNFLNQKILMIIMKQNNNIISMEYSGIN
jgi:hypothetical protein